MGKEGPGPISSVHIYPSDPIRSLCVVRTVASLLSCKDRGRGIRQVRCCCIWSPLGYGTVPACMHVDTVCSPPPRMLCPRQNREPASSVARVASSIVCGVGWLRMRCGHVRPPARPMYVRIPDCCDWPVLGVRAVGFTSPGPRAHETARPAGPPWPGVG